MSQTSENESEIVLGNKQLAGIFLMVAILLGVAFTGGYMVGRGGSASKKAAAVASSDPAASSESAASSSAAPTVAGGQTHTVGTDDTLAAAASHDDSPAPHTANPLGARKSREVAPAPVRTAEPDAERAAPASSEGYSPRPGSKYLQVAAVSRDEAEAVADVLHRKGFHAHAVPKPGNVKLYRVIIGPVRDAGDLSTTRDALRKTGFREVIVQSY